MSSQNLLFGMGNRVPESVIGFVSSGVNDIENIKSHHRSRQAVWRDPPLATVSFGGYFTEDVVADFIAIPGHNLQPDATVKITLRATSFTDTDLLAMDAEVIIGSLPLGVWQSGIDEYGNNTAQEANGTFIKWFDAPMTFKYWTIEVTHGFPSRVTLPSTTACQDPISGFLSMDSSDGVVSDTDGANEWATTSNAEATEGTYLEKVGASTYTVLAGAPQITFTFRATMSGLHDFYLRTKVTAGNTFVNVTFDGATNVRSYAVTTDLNWQTSHRLFLTAGSTHTIIISAYHASFIVDKIILQPPGLSAPTDDGYAVSNFGYVMTTDYVSLRMVYMGRKVQMDNNFRFGGTIRFLTPGDVITSASGYALRGVMQSLAKRISVVLDNATDSDKIALAALEIRLLGVPFIVSAYPESAEWVAEAYSMLANFESSINYTHVFDDIHEVQLDLLEA